MQAPVPDHTDERGNPAYMMCRGQRFVWGVRTYVMGVVNISADSFSGDGTGDDVQAAVDQARRFEEEGADIIDVGGESTRAFAGHPRYEPISEDEELRRVMPVLERLISQVSVPVSIDTYKSGVARRALDAGVSMLNDIWGLQYDSALAGLAAEHNVPIVLMHNQKGTRYHDLISDVKAVLARSVGQAVEAGVPREAIIVDPGIGFAKGPEHNLQLISRLRELRELGFPLLVGPSRKSFIGLVLDLPVEQRMEGTAAAVALSVANGADIVRVHDVQTMVRVTRMADAVVRGWQRPDKR
ncbi:MAG: dihydropteroate synthase [Chloroflexi bacterium]|nr:dihydropteroate synthase [Chloroflexota bacterium]